MGKKGHSVTVDIPRPGEDRPAWSRVGVVAAIAFAVGIAWPSLLGVRIGPDVPGKHDKAEPVPAEPEASAEDEAGVPEGRLPSAPAGRAVTKHQTVNVSDGKLVGCRDKDKKKVDSCGTLKFDRIAKPKLAELAKCPSALGLDGELSIGFEIDFEGKKVTVLKGEDTTLPTSTVRGVLACAAEEFGEAELHKVAHTHRYYTVFYDAEFLPPGTPIEEDGADDEKGTPAEAAGAESEGDGTKGMASVSWDTALLRKQPKDGEITARLMRGTRVKLLDRQDDWYRVDAGMATGWVHKQAIGMD
jgi:hypothetical protein